MKIVSEPYVKDGTAVFDVGGFSVSVVLEEIDSVTAAQYLRTSPGNRSLSGADRYAIDVKDGKWYLTGETIIFDDSEELADGHNRLTEW